MVKLFTQVLKRCQKANLEKLGHIALDDTKVHANASKHKAMSHERMLKSKQELKREIGELLATAQKQDKTKDKQFRKVMLGDELPKELQFKRRRLEKIREAKEALEREAQEKAEGKGREGAKRGGKKGNGGGKGKFTEVKPKAQRNFTDPDSRIMIDKAANAFQQSYNCQAAVDVEAQVIVAT